ncbi:MAG: hypothetical protein B7Z08_05755 [Sphingomonadales bacterium 32-68-7]|nr:MAG: hypothetical protein B7Z33_06170 [Sphingomonadales bacterium 12-68-11]OYX09346.1 MAG: hypothetical protein B7Z08_05755 [Sphingomonadales bacterium 32-68-7]
MPLPDSSADAVVTTESEPATETAEALPAEPAAPMTADAAPAATSVTDAEVESFAAATVKVQAIDTDTTIAADLKQTQMAAAVAEAGIAPQRYNEIGQALSTDTALRTRVQTAMAKHAGHSPSDG